MDGFKNSTKTQYMRGGECYAKGGSVKGAAKISKVMGEFKSGTLHSGSKSGPKVSNPKQAVAIALSESRKAAAPVKKATGGTVASPFTASGAMPAGAQLSSAAEVAAARKAAADNFRAGPINQKTIADAKAAGDARRAALDAKVAARQAAQSRDMRPGITVRQLPPRAAAAAPRAAIVAPARSAAASMTGGTGRPVVAAAKGGKIDGKLEASIRSAERMQGEEANEMRAPSAPRSKPRSLTVTKTTVSEGVPRTELDRRLSELPTEAEMRASRGKASGFRSIPLVGDAMRAMGLKRGGLSAMPKGKK